MLPCPVRGPQDIQYPKSVSEFEIHAYLFSSLKQVGVNVRGCVQSSGAVHVFDLVVFDVNLHPIEIIEVKKDVPSKGEKKKASAKHAAQTHRYSQYQVPVTLITGMVAAKTYLAKWIDDTEYNI